MTTSIVAAWLRFSLSLSTMSRTGLNRVDPCVPLVRGETAGAAMTRPARSASRGSHADAVRAPRPAGVPVGRSSCARFPAHRGQEMALGTQAV
jgi:hypothetical protein